MKEVVDGKCKSALRSVATICAPDLVVSVVTRADLIANWRLAGSTYDQFIRAFDPDRRLLLQLGVSTPDVHLSAQAELQSWVDTQPNASDERMWKLLRLGAAAAESVGRAFPATAGVASASELARILVPPWVRTLAPDEPFPLELHPLVRFLDGDEIALILAKTPMAHRAPLLRRLPVRLLNVNEQILALAPPEILAMLAEESTKAAADASQTARRRRRPRTGSSIRSGCCRATTPGSMMLRSRNGAPQLGLMSSRAR